MQYSEYLDSKGVILTKYINFRTNFNGNLGSHAWIQKRDQGKNVFVLFFPFVITGRVELWKMKQFPRRQGL